MTKRLKVATVGAGYFSQFHYDAWARCPQVDRVAICNRHIEAAQTLAKEYDIPSCYSDFTVMLEEAKPDWVDIITPPHTHLQYVEACAAQGVNMIVQKPFGANLTEAKRMVQLAQEADVALVVHENFRFMPWYRAIKAELESGRMGDVLNVRYDLRPGDGQGPEAYLDRQPYFQKMEKFLIHETAVHLIDTFRYLFGNVTSVYADLRRCNPAIVGEDAGIVLFDMANGVRATFDGNRLLDHAAENRRTTMGEMRIEGTEGSLYLDGNAQLNFRAFNSNDFEPIPYEWEARNFGGDCVYALIRHVVSHVVDGTPLENTGREYLQNLMIESAIYRSQEQQKKEILHGSD